MVLWCSLGLCSFAPRAPSVLVPAGYLAGYAGGCSLRSRPELGIVETDIGIAAGTVRREPAAQRRAVGHRARESSHCASLRA